MSSFTGLNAAGAVRSLALAALLPADTRDIRVPSPTPQKTATTKLEISGDLQVAGTLTKITGSLNCPTTAKIVSTGQAGVPWLISRVVSYTLYGQALGDTRLEQQLSVGPIMTHVNSGRGDVVNFDAVMLAVDFLAGEVMTYGRSEYTATYTTYPTMAGAFVSNTARPARRNSFYLPALSELSLTYGILGTALEGANTINSRIVVTRFNPDGTVDSARPVDGIGLVVPGGVTDHYYDAATNISLAPGVYQISWEGTDQTTAWTAGSQLLIGVKLVALEKEALVPLDPPYIYTNEEPYTATRCTSSSVLLSNASSVLNKEGTVLCARMDARHDWSNTISQANQVAAGQVATEKKYTGCLADGVYTFMPYMMENLAFSDYRDDALVAMTLTVPAEKQAVPVYYWTRNVPYHVLYLSDKDAASATNILYKMVLHLEFATDSALFSQGVCQTRLTDLDDTMRLISSMPFFYENPGHWDWIQNKLNAAWRRVAPYAPDLVRALGATARRAFPEVEPIVRAYQGFRGR